MGLRQSGLCAGHEEESMKSAIRIRVVCSVTLVTALVSGAWANAQFPGMSQAKHYPWSDANLSPDVRADLAIKELTLDEKIQLVHGLGWQTMFMPLESGPGTRAISALGFIPGIPRLGIP